VGAGENHQGAEGRNRQQVWSEDNAPITASKPCGAGELRIGGFVTEFGVKAKEQVGSDDLVMVRKRRYGRAKGRSEFSAPGGRENAGLKIDRRHAGGSINRAVNPA